MDITESDVIEQEHTHIDYETTEGIKIVEEKKEELEQKTEKEVKTKNERCKYIKKNGKRCRQCGKPKQTGGPIINGYCSFHKNKQG